MDRIAEFNHNVQRYRRQVEYAVPTEKWSLLPLDFTPRPQDVICSKRKDATDHPGNRRLQVMIELCLERYVQAKSKVEKSIVVSDIMSSVYHANGLFIRQGQGGRWCQIDVDAARKKTGQTLRDTLDKKKRQSKEAQKKKIESRQPYDADTEAVSSRRSATCIVSECVAAAAAAIIDDDYSEDNNSITNAPLSTTTTSSDAGKADVAYEPLPLVGLHAKDHSVDSLKAFAPLLQFWFCEH